MPLFKVTNIIDGNTIEVAGWQWGDYAGKLIKVADYKISPKYNDFAKSKLMTLILGKEVELKNPTDVTKGTEPNSDVLHCSIFLNEVNISLYFPELQEA
jgi:hypothetical protein